MWWKILISFVVITISGDFALADCPSADLNGDCCVNFEDFAIMVTQWLTCGIPDDMVSMGGDFLMGDHHGEGSPDEVPIHLVLLDSFFMSKFEITNRQYCDYLNSAYDAGDIKIDGGMVYASSDSSNSYPYCETSTSSTSSLSQIDYSCGIFSVRTKGGRNMSDDPMVLVIWYGAVAYCNWRSQKGGYEQCYNLSTWTCDFTKKGYRLPTEAEWEYAARGGLSGKRFPWGDTINHDYANYVANGSFYSYDTSPYTTYTYHPDWNDGVQPYTSPVGSFSPNGYGLYDMAGNVREWCNDWYDSNYYSTSPTNDPRGPISGSARVQRGGSWYSAADNCRVADRSPWGPGGLAIFIGFRIVLDLN